MAVLFPELKTEYIPFGCQPLPDVLNQQLAYVELVRRHPDRAFVLYGEHSLTYTAGRALKASLPEALLGLPVEPVSRGGQLTCHGPGQLVIYPIVSIKAVAGIPALLQRLERWLGTALDELGLPTLYPPPCGTPERPATGVWLDSPNGPQKVASIGIALKHWVSYHGVALNVCNPMVPFHAINPCGFNAQVMTSVHHHWVQHHPGTLPPSYDNILSQLYLN